MQSRSIIAWRPGASSRRDLLGAHRGQRQLVREEELGREQAADDDQRLTSAGARRGSTPMKTTYRTPSRNSVSSIRN